MIKSAYFIFLCVIVITKNTANIVVVTLEEKRTITNAKYLFKFVRDEAISDIAYCIPTDTSLYPERYNKFSITDTPTPAPLSGQVNLNSGFYHYYVYEQVSSTNLDPTGLTLVEQGKALCITTLPTEYTHTITLTEEVYNG